MCARNWTVDARPGVYATSAARCGVLWLSIGSSYGGWWTVQERRGERDGEQNRGEVEGEGEAQPAEERCRTGGGRPGGRRVDRGGFNEPI